jgi:hypothetical protein
LFHLGTASIDFRQKSWKDAAKSCVLFTLPVLNVTSAQALQADGLP